MVGWHYQLNGHEPEQTPGDSGGQGSLACYTSWGQKESDTAERLNNNGCMYLFEISPDPCPGVGFAVTLFSVF